MAGAQHSLTHAGNAPARTCDRSRGAGYRTAHYGKWHLGGCSPPGTHTPMPSEYGFDRTATHGSPLEAKCVNSTAVDGSLGPESDLMPDKRWWSADVDGVRTVARPRNPAGPVFAS